MARTSPTLISLFTGAGGLDLGLEEAGFDCRAALEIDVDCRKTIAANRNWPILASRVDKVSGRELLATAGLKPGSVDLLAGGPPCQPFSKSAYWLNGDSRRMADPRATCLEHFIRLVGEIRPRCFLLENVPGLGFQQKNEGLQRIEAALRTVNRGGKRRYRIEHAVLNAADFGAPQIRKRLFLVGFNVKSEFEFPQETHGPMGSVEVNEGLREPYRTAWDALGEGPADPQPVLNMGGKWADLLPSVPEGSNYLHLTPRGEGMSLFGWRTRYWSFLLKLAKEKPSWTLTAQPGSATGPFHWDSRRLAVEELLALQTFPAGYKIKGNLRSGYRQVGNAVPPLLGEVLGRAILEQLLGHGAFEKQLSLLPGRREAPPPPVEARPVPKKYWPLEACHDPHPGEGRGPRARQRVAAPAS